MYRTAEIQITRGGIAVARLTPIPSPAVNRLGIDKGRMTVQDDFDDEDAELIADFENSDHVPA